MNRNILPAPNMPLTKFMLMAHIDAATPYGRHERPLLDRARNQAPGRAWWGTLIIVGLAILALATMAGSK